MEPMLIGCAACREQGCELCKDGFIKYTGCPSKVLGRKYSDLSHDAILLDKGVLPKSGGTYDQDGWLMNAMRLFLSYKNEMENLE